MVEPSAPRRRVEAQPGLLNQILGLRAVADDTARIVDQGDPVAMSEAGGQG